MPDIRLAYSTDPAIWEHYRQKYNGYFDLDRGKFYVDFNKNGQLDSYEGVQVQLRSDGGLDTVHLEKEIKTRISNPYFFEPKSGQELSVAPSDGIADTEFDAIIDARESADPLSRNDAILQIAAKSGHPRMLDNESEKSQARNYFLAWGHKWKNNVGWDKERAQKFFDAANMLLSGNYFMVVSPNSSGSDQLVTRTPFHNNVKEQLVKIAALDGAPHLIDSDRERRAAIEYLGSIGNRLSVCETSAIDKIAEQLVAGATLQINPIFITDKDVDNNPHCTDAWYSGLLDLGFRDPLPSFVTELPVGKFMAYNSTSNTCPKDSDSACMYSFGYVQMSLDKKEFDTITLKLAKARSAEEERLILLDVLRSFPGFPSGEDCTHQGSAAAKFLWVLSANGHLKWHRYEPNFGVFKSDAFRHFASGVRSKNDGKIYVIDTWASVVVPFDEWVDTVYEHHVPK